MSDESDLNPVSTTAAKAWKIGSPYFPVPEEQHDGSLIKQKKITELQSADEEKEPIKETYLVPSLLMPLRKFSFDQKHTFKSYASSDQSSGSAVKVVEEMKAKIITEIPIAKGRRKSRLQALLDMFPLEKLTIFLTTTDVYALSLCSFYFHTRVYDLEGTDYRVSIPTLLKG